MIAIFMKASADDLPMFYILNLKQFGGKSCCSARIAIQSSGVAPGLLRKSSQ
jgi:hypothetical protein